MKKAQGLLKKLVDNILPKSEKCQHCCQTITLSNDGLVWHDGGIFFTDMCTLSPTMRHEPEVNMEVTDNAA